jgi:hydroxyacylglutathione hydrolase
MEIRALRTPGLGDTSYVLSHDGQVVVVDPQRDLDRFEAVIGQLGGDVRFVLETHVHNDYLSGGRELARATGAELVFPAGAAPVFRHRPAFHNEDIEGAGFSIRPIHTPGHTPEHTSYAVNAEGSTVAVFSGGSLLTGSAGRSDLLGWDRAESLARLQYGSVHRLAALPGETRLCPTHGAGSFCTAAPAGRYESTIGQERVSNPALLYDDEDSFVEAQLADLPAYPAYYAQMGPMNLKGVGPAMLGEPPEIDAAELVAVGDTVTIVDGRPPERFAEGHVAGSLSVHLNRSFGVWVGWLVEFGATLVLVLDPDQDSAEAVRQLTRIGFDDIRGVFRDVGSWPGAKGRLEVGGAAGFADAALAGEQLVDTRAPSEWATGTVPGSQLVYVPDVGSVSDATLDRSRPVWVLCESGFRAAIAASQLVALGYRPVLLAEAGVTEVLDSLSERV